MSSQARKGASTPSTPAAIRTTLPRGSGFPLAKRTLSSFQERAMVARPWRTNACDETLDYGFVPKPFVAALHGRGWSGGRDRQAELHAQHLSAHDCRRVQDHAKLAGPRRSGSQIGDCPFNAEDIHQPSVNHMDWQLLGRAILHDEFTDTEHPPTCTVFNASGGGGHDHTATSSSN